MRAPGDDERLDPRRVGNYASYRAIRDFGAVTQIQNTKVVG